MSKSVFSKTKTIFGRKKEDEDFLGEMEEDRTHTLIEETLKEEEEVRDEEEKPSYEAVREDKTLREARREEGKRFLVEGAEKEGVLPLEIRRWEKGEVIEDLYEVKEVIGTGGMGVVYIVNHRKWDVPLAVKSPRQEIIPSREGKSRFFREAEAWIDIGKHPDIATAYYVRAIDGISRIFMEYVDGGSLKNWIEQGKLKDWEDILRIAIEFCNGMAYAHDRGLIHRDINPANVLMTKEGRVKITDFGLIKGAAEFLSSPEEGGVKESWKTMTGVGGVFGTPAYISPEQWDNPHGVGREGDVYSFGVMLFEMITGKRPFEPSPEIAPQAKVFFYKKMHKEDQPQEIKKLREDINPKLEMLVLRCLAKEKENRYNSFEDVKSELEGIYKEVVGTPYHAEVVDAVALKADDLNNKALSFRDLGQEEEAVRCWQEALKVNPLHMEATFNLGYWEWTNAKTTDDQYLHRIFELENTYANDPIYWHSLGLIHMERWDLEGAKNALKNAIELGSNESEVYSVLGIAYLGLEEFEAAKEAFIEAIKLSQDKWQPRFHFALTFFKAGEMGDCLEELSTIFDKPKWKGELRAHEIKDVNEALECFAEIDIPCFRLIKVLYEDNFQRNTVITSTVFSPDGKYALFSGDKTLQLWDVKTGECIRTFKGPTREVNSATFSPDGRCILTGSNDNTLRLWDVETDKCIKTFEGHTDWVKSVAFSPDGKCALSGSNDKSIRLWDIESGDCITTLKGHTDHVVSVAFSSDGKHALSGSNDKSIRLWDIETGDCIRTFERHTDHVKSVKFSPDGKQALSGSLDKTIRLWNVKTGECIRIFGGTWEIEADEGGISFSKINIPPVNSVAFSPDGRYALSGSKEASPRLWDVETGKCLILSKGPLEDDFLDMKYDIQSVSFSPDGRYALFGGDCNFCALWDVETGNRVKIFSQGYARHTKSVSFSPDGKYALSGDSDGKFRLWDVKIGECIKTFKEHSSGNTESLSFSQDGRYALSGDSLSGIHLWDVETGESIRTFEGPTAHKNATLFSDGRYALSGGWGEGLCIWDVETGKCIKTFKGDTAHANLIKSVALSPNGKYALSGSKDKTIRLWDVKTGDCVKTLEGHDSDVDSVTFSPNGKYALSGSHNSLRLWDVETGLCIRTFEGHAEYVSSLIFSPNGLYALSVGSTLRLWNIKTGRCIRTFKEKASLTVTFSPDGKYALSGGNLSLWNVKYPTDISIYPHFNFMLCSPIGVLESAREEKRVKELIAQARSLIESESFSQAYRLSRKAQEYQGFERSPEIMELITLCSKKGKRVCLRDVWLRKIVEGPGSWPHSVPFSSDGKYAVARYDLIDRDKTLQLWDLKAGKCVRTFAGHTYGTYSVVFSPDGKYVLSGGDVSSVGAVRSGSVDLLRLWDVKTGECIRTFERHKFTVNSVAFSPDGRYVLIGGHGVLHLWDVKTNKFINIFEGHTSGVDSLNFSTDGKYALSGSYDKTIRQWNVETGECIRTLTGHNHWVTSVAFAPDGRYALSGSNDKTIRLWDLKTGKCIRTLEGHTNEVNSVAFNPGGRYALSGSEDKTIRLWDTETGDCIRTFEGHTSAVTSVAFTSNGRYALSGSWDKTIRVWEFDWELEFDEN